MEGVEEEGRRIALFFPKVQLPKVATKWS